MKILSLIPFEKEDIQKLNAVVGDNRLFISDNESLSDNEIAQSEIILGNIPPERLRCAHNLRWLQLNSAGVDAYVADGVLPEGVMLTNCKGAFDLALAEHTLAALLMLMKNLHLYRDNHNMALWRDEGKADTIVGAKVLIIGFGSIGKEFGRKVAALGGKVYGITRTMQETPDYAKGVYTVDNLHKHLPDADVVMACLPSTPDTNNLLGEKEFSMMKDGAYFINVGRGSTLNEEALYKALVNGKLAGASIDVTAVEPLPISSKLWGLKNLLITPHISGWYHLKNTYTQIADIVMINLARYLKGEELINKVEIRRGY